MILSKSDYNYYIKADSIAKSKSFKRGFKYWVKEKLNPDLVWEFQVLLRKLEYSTNCKKGFFSKIERGFISWKFQRISYKLGFSIPTNVFGPGLSIAHYGNIVINKGTKIGANCRLHSGVNIGTEAGFSNLAPILGDNCYIGPGAKIFGSIQIASGCAIGANAVVTKSCSDANMALMGIPARPIKTINSKKLLIPATELIKLDIPQHIYHGKSANEVFNLIFEKRIVESDNY